MDPKKFIIVSFMAFVIACSGNVWTHPTSAAAGAYDNLTSGGTTTNPDDFLQALGVENDEEIYDALYSGKSLAEIANDNEKEVQHIIDLQVSQLKHQLDERLLRGTLSLSDYQAQVSELTEMITQSVHGQLLQ
ncbi:hypothetical protein BVG16_18460 [Paenibacillus selenitireducens]|jgi:hypothetical protein|uniref:Uncharacterized protein n=1 Tax=Paenibacillus selenitireducens TaxID=1324314 RepID=A0A1T2X8I6_9BACL|nr:hypothetical protein [Paenibacillus selenitireducens]OPA76191.1 hypothetical protein BVG16_18460 [Paenibacillus selenitireducens]